MPPAPDAGKPRGFSRPHTLTRQPKVRLNTRAETPGPHLQK